MFKGVFIAVLIGSAVLSFAGIASLGQKEQEYVQFTSGSGTNLAGVFTAAECAGFPPVVAMNLERLYSSDKFVELIDLPDSYEVKMVVVHTTAGGCLTTQAPLLPKAPAGKGVRLRPAVALIDVDDVKGEGLPLYVLWELSTAEGSLDRVFVTMRLPAPASDDRPTVPVGIA